MGEIDLTKMRDADGRASSAPLVLLGVTGCIAAYKSCEVLRGLQKAGVSVKVVMTKNACEFVGPTTFRALTHEPVAVDTFGDGPGDPIHHVSLAEECDLFLIAPCTANVLAKMAAGIADDLLSTTALACTAPIAVAPAMNVHMYEAARPSATCSCSPRAGCVLSSLEKDIWPAETWGEVASPTPRTSYRMSSKCSDARKTWWENASL